MLRVLKVGACGWVDWNLLLDYTGGPNHLGDVVMLPFMLNRTRWGRGPVVLGCHFAFLQSTSYLVVVEYKRTCEAPSDRGAQVTEARASVGFELTMWPCEATNTNTSAELALDQ